MSTPSQDPSADEPSPFPPPGPVPPQQPPMPPPADYPGYSQQGPPTGYLHAGYAQPGYQQPGYQQPGYPPGYSQPGYPQQGGPYNPNVPYGFGPGYAASGRLATWLPRVGATLLDGLIIAGFEIVAVIIIAASSTSSTYDPNTGETTGGGVSGVGLALAGVIYLGAFAFSLYQLYRQGTTGQTIGKKVVGIRVIREIDGQFTGFGMAFVRGLAHLLDALPCYIGFLWPLWDDKKQTFADKVCGTVVVRD